MYIVHVRTYMYMHVVSFRFVIDCGREITYMYYMYRYCSATCVYITICILSAD
jgi:hypothetical protein